jgi:hypothetical protein
MLYILHISHISFTVSALASGPALHSPSVLMLRKKILL